MGGETARFVITFCLYKLELVKWRVISFIPFFFSNSEFKELLLIFYDMLYLLFSWHTVVLSASTILLSSLMALTGVHLKMYVQQVFNMRIANITAVGAGGTLGYPRSFSVF